MFIVSKPITISINEPFTLSISQPQAGNSTVINPRENYTQPVIYLARTFQTDIDTVVKFFIFILIFVFDPMAVMFVISYNVALQDRYDDKQKSVAASTNPNITITDSSISKPKKKWPVYGEKKQKIGKGGIPAPKKVTKKS